MCLRVAQEFRRGRQSQASQATPVIGQVEGKAEN